MAKSTKTSKNEPNNSEEEETDEEEEEKVEKKRLIPSIKKAKSQAGSGNPVGSLKA